MSCRVSQENRDAAYMRLENARSATEQSSSGSMEAMHIMEGLLNTGMQLGGMMLGMLGSCAGCAGM
ncbi:MAG: hypothetical protein IPG45_17895 [Deltaproteobacteria bacterium]|jgi:hypothetical protein|nr:hypothetical protein [Deltaproteobacteria bacterium]